MLLIKKRFRENGCSSEVSGPFKSCVLLLPNRNAVPLQATDTVDSFLEYVREFVLHKLAAV